MRIPFAEWRPVSLRSSQYRINPAGLVFHTAVSNSTLLWPTGTVRWHFYNNKYGKLYQFFDTTVSAACQLDGNYWRENGKPFGFLSMESWDGAGTSVWPDYRTNHNGGPSWTDDQMETNEKLAYFLHEEHGITLRLATGARGRGFGYHRQFTNTNPYEWNRSHACPGNRRANQVPIIIRNANQNGSTDSGDWWFDHMATEAQKNELSRIVGRSVETQLRDEVPRIVKKAIDDRTDEIAKSAMGRTLNERIPTGQENLDTGNNPGRPIGWHLRTIRNRIDALAAFSERTAAIEANRHAEGSAERIKINEEIQALKQAFADADNSES